LRALEQILGTSLEKDPTSDGNPEDEPPEGLDEPIDFQGLSLDEFVTKGSRAQKGSAVHSTRIQSEQCTFFANFYSFVREPRDLFVRVDEKDRQRFEDLHKAITACDQVLKSVETYLTGFQADLGAVSSEIETLQSRSSSMNSKLENRRVVEKLLGPAVEEFSLSPEVVKKIVDGPIDESWIKALAELEKRSKSVQAKAKEQKKTRALDDLLPILENLTNKVSST
jgi:vacuolar protein sorting-associated protein 52